MYLFFMLCGYIFVVGGSIILNYLYEVFSVNKLTKFLSPDKDTIFNNIGIILIPNFVWALIEIVMIGNNYYFIIGFILNIVVSLCVMYIVIYGYKLFTDAYSNLVRIIAFFISCVFGFAINYFALLSAIDKEGKLSYSLLGLFIIIGFYLIIRKFPPKSYFFRGESDS